MSNVITAPFVEGGCYTLHMSWRDGMNELPDKHVRCFVFIKQRDDGEYHCFIAHLKNDGNWYTDRMLLTYKKEFYWLPIPATALTFDLEKSLRDCLTSLGIGSPQTAIHDLAPLLMNEVTIARKHLRNSLEADLDHMPKQEFATLIRCAYYKPSGKWYTTGQAYFDNRLLAGLIYPSEYGKHLRRIKQLPGLQSGTWSGPFTCDVQGKYCELIMGESDGAG